MKIAPDRVISVPLSEEDWRVFLAAEREPVQWLKEQIAYWVGGPGWRSV